MNSQELTYCFEPEIVKKMDEFAKDFLHNEYKKDTSQNKGPNYKEKIAQEDSDAFGEFLDSDYSDDFLNLE